MPDREHARRSAHASVPRSFDTQSIGKATLIDDVQPRSGGSYAPTLTGNGKKQSGLEVLANAVTKIEGILTTLSPKALEKVLAPDAVIADTAQSLLMELDRLGAALGTANVEPTEATPHLQRLERAFGKLFTLGRQYHVPQRQSGLEELFDREDDLRLRLHYPGGRANRAELYYDDNLQSKQALKPLAIQDGADPADLAGDDSKAPRTRDDLVTDIVGLGVTIGAAIHRALEDAKQAIEEPSAPRSPDLLEMLGEAAAEIILANANLALGKVLGAAAKAIDQKSGLVFKIGKYSTKQIGAHMTRELLHGFGHAGTDVLKKGAGVALQQSNKPPARPHDDRGDDEALSARSIYIKHARHSTSDRAAGIETHLAGMRGELKRVPVETLQAIAATYDEQRMDEIYRELYAVLVREWVNFAKRAADAGEEVRDEQHRPKTPTKLDNVLAPTAEVRIEVVLAKDGTVQFRRATLPGVSDKVLRDIQNQRGTLATVSLYRRVAFSGRDEMDPAHGSFTVDPQGKIGIDRMSDQDRQTIARLANPLFADGALASRFDVRASDDDVLSGIERILPQLTMSLRKIEGKEG